MHAWTFDFNDRIKRELASEFPDNDDMTLNAVATGIAGMFFNSDALVSLGGMKQLHDASKQAALLLVSVLEE